MNPTNFPNLTLKGRDDHETRVSQAMVVRECCRAARLIRPGVHSRAFSLYNSNFEFRPSHLVRLSTQHLLPVFAEQFLVLPRVAGRSTMIIHTIKAYAFRGRLSS